MFYLGVITGDVIRASSRLAINFFLSILSNFASSTSKNLLILLIAEVDVAFCFSVYDF